MRTHILFAIVCLVLLSYPAYADELLLKNNDRLTGKIISLSDGKLLFKLDLDGEVTVALSDIQTLSSKEPVIVNLKDKTTFKQRLVSAAAGRFAVEGSEAMKAQEFAVADIVSINPPIPKWTGDISVGITSTHGNTKTDTMTASANFLKRTENDRTTISADYAKGEKYDPVTGNTITIEDWWRAKGRYDYFFSKKMFGFVDGRYEKDSVAQLDRRMIIGVGGGYQWIETDKTKFSTEVGLASLYEKFDNQDSTSEISLQLGYNLDHKLMDNIKLTHDLTYYPSIKKFSDYYLTTTAGLRADFTDTFFTAFKVIFNYDSTPAAGMGNTDVKYFLGLGYRF
jgi:putative salt-induced outer membrane protein